MKKIALLFTMLFASALNGMESLPQEIHSVIIKKALETSRNLNEAITAIKNLSVVHAIQYDKLFGNQKEFTNLVQTLAKKFKVTTQKVAEQFKTLAAQEYLQLAQELTTAIVMGKKNEVIQLIEQGADINFIGTRGDTPLGLAVLYSDIVKILLNAGAQVRGNDITTLANNIGRHPRPEPLKSLNLLEKAYKEQYKQD